MEQGWKCAARGSLLLNQRLDRLQQLVVVTAEHLKAVEDGVLAACTRGDELGFPLMDARITLVSVESFRVCGGTS